MPGRQRHHLAIAVKEPLDDRPTASSAAGDDARFDLTLRPRNFAEVVGQRALIDNLRVFVKAAAALALIGAGILRRCTHAGGGIFLAALVSAVPVARVMGPLPMAPSPSRYRPTSERIGRPV